MDSVKIVGVFYGQNGICVVSEAVVCALYIIYLNNNNTQLNCGSTGKTSMVGSPHVSYICL